MHKEFYWGNIMDDVHLVDREGDGRIILKWVLRISFVRMKGGWNLLSIAMILGVLNLGVLLTWLSFN
jgi:hypothetical protein